MDNAGRLGAAAGLAQLDFTAHEIKPISEGHSLISLCRGPIQMFVLLGPIQIAQKSPKNRAACVCGVRWVSLLAARAADKYISSKKIAELPKKAPPAANLRGSR
jgi:hypothetical protein